MDRRDLIRGAGLLATGAALGGAPAGAQGTDECGRAADPQTIVMVHGANVGAFTLTPVAEILRRKGHRVFVPALTGLGERSHLLSREVNMSTHVADITNLIRYEDLREVVLVAHSYGGLVITGAADAMADRVASLVHLDTMIAEDGKSAADLTGDVDGWQAAWDAGEAGQPLGRAAPGFLTPHPLGAFLEKMHLTGAWESVANKSYVRASRSMQPPFLAAWERVSADPSWTTRVIDAEPAFPLFEIELAAALVEELM